MDPVIKIQTNNMLSTEYDLSKFLLGDNEFISGTAGASVTLLEGEVMGRISASGLLIPCVHGVSDGSQYPVGIVIQGKAVTSGVTEITLVNKGRIAEAKINFSTATSLTDVVSGRQIKDWLNDLGLIVSSATELTAFDNS